MFLKFATKILKYFQSILNSISKAKDMNINFHGVLILYELGVCSGILLIMNRVCVFYKNVLSLP